MHNQYTDANLTMICFFTLIGSAQNKCLTAKLLQKGYWYHKLRKTCFLNFIADTIDFQI